MGNDDIVLAIFIPLLLLITLIYRIVLKIFNIGNKKEKTKVVERTTYTRNVARRTCADEVYKHETKQQPNCGTVNLW